MPWIESHTTLRVHKKLKPLCDDLGITRAQAIGHLHMLWWWTIEYRETGDLNSLYETDIAAACDWRGDAKKIVKALKKHGWITENNFIKDWMDYAGFLLRDRARKRLGRARGTSADESALTVPYRTVPDLTIKKQWFDELWKAYPRKIGMKAAERHFMTSVKTEDDLANIKKALANYTKSETVVKGFIQHGSTWFNNWQDWIQNPVASKAASLKTVKCSVPGCKEKAEIPTEQYSAHREACERRFRAENNGPVDPEVRKLINVACGRSPEDDGEVLKK